MKLTNLAVLSLHGALLKLDPFKFNPRTVYRLARNLRLVADALKDVDAARKRILGTLADRGLVEQARQDADAAFSVVLDESVSIDLQIIDWQDLDLATNAIPASILAMLDPILTGVVD